MSYDTPSRAPQFVDDFAYGSLSGAVNRLNSVPNSPYQESSEQVVELFLKSPDSPIKGKLSFAPGTSAKNVLHAGQHIEAQTPSGTKYTTSAKTNRCAVECEDDTCLHQAKLYWFSIESRISNAKSALERKDKFDVGHQRALAIDVQAAEQCLRSIAKRTDTEAKYWVRVVVSVVAEANALLEKHTGGDSWDLQSTPRLLFKN
jgi:hypothetical protein